MGVAAVAWAGRAQQLPPDHVCSCAPAIRRNAASQQVTPQYNAPYSALSTVALSHRGPTALSKARPCTTEALRMRPETAHGTCVRAFSGCALGWARPVDAGECRTLSVDSADLRRWYG